MSQLPPWVRALPVGELATNCYLLTGSDGDVAVIDPGGDPRAIDRAFRECGPAARLRMALLTHAHGDHWAALPALLRSYPGCAVAASASALEWLASAQLNLSAWLGEPMALRPEHPYPLADGDRVQVCGMDLAVIASPGHTPGCVCFYRAGGEGSGREPVLFAGDTLFRGSVGRTDLPGGSWTTLAASLRKLAALPPATLVLPGHGGVTTIEREVAGNEFLRRAARG